MKIDGITEPEKHSNKIIHWICLLLFTILIQNGAAGCSSYQDIPEPEMDPYYVEKETDRLSPEEMKALIYHAQKFVQSSESLRLTDAERKMIVEKYPEIYDKYYGEKYGRVDFYWELSSKKVLQLTARGYLLKKKLNWYVQIKNMLSSSPYKGKNWKQNDTLALPPAENVREFDRGGRRI